MKKITYVLIILCFVGQKLAAQTVTIPDIAFQQCLVEKYPNTIDVNKNLILSEAVKNTNSLVCSGRAIQNAEGIQFFTNIIKLDLSDNALAYLPDLSALTKLEQLDVSDNKLISLPALSSLTYLKGLYVQRNQLTGLPSLAANTALEVLYVHTNNLGTLPSLAGLIHLQQINAAYCNLTELPDLSGLTALQSLQCWKNSLTKLPDLSSLPHLTLLDAGYNSIEAFPVLGAHSAIQTIYLPFNKIDTLPDISGFSQLEKLRIYNNELTFTDLLPLVDFAGYDTIIPFTPQKVFKVGINKKVKEAEKLELKTGIDENVPNVQYEWFFNGALKAITDSSALVLSKVTFSDSGYYYCKITHPSFPGFSLVTDSFHVKVTPCMNLSAFSEVLTGISCTKAATLSIEPNQSGSFSYMLTSAITKDTIRSYSGMFSQLTEDRYKLLITSAQCVKEYPKPIVIPKDECKEVFITPNGDGVDDSYFFSASGKAVIRDKWGNSVLKLSIPAKWNGMGISGKVSPGLYIVDINDGEDVLKMTVIY